MNSSPARRGTLAPARAARSSVRSLTFRTCKTTVLTVRSSSPDNMRSARASNRSFTSLSCALGLLFAALEAPFRRAPAPIGSAPSSSRLRLPRCPCTAPRLALWRGRPSPATTPSPLSLSVDIRGLWGQIHEPLYIYLREYQFH